MKCTLFDHLDPEDAFSLLMECYVLLPLRQMQACGEPVQVYEYTQEVPFAYTLVVGYSEDDIVCGMRIGEGRAVAAWTGLGKWDALVERSGEPLTI